MDGELGAGFAGAQTPVGGDVEQEGGIKVGNDSVFLGRYGRNRSQGGGR